MADRSTEGQGGEEKRQRKSIVEPGGPLGKAWPKVALVSVEAVVGWSIGYFLTHVIPVPSASPGFGRETLVAYYLCGYGFIAILGGTAYHWLWRPIWQLRDNSSKLYDLLTQSGNLLKTRAMGDDPAHKAADYADLESMVLGRAIGIKIVDCFEDVKGLADIAFVVLAVLVPLVTFGAFYVPSIGYVPVLFLLAILLGVGAMALFRVVWVGPGWYGVGEWKRQISALYDKSKLTNAQEGLIDQLKDWAKTHPAKYPVKGGFSR